MRSAVPLGASTFMRWCVSTISTSKPSASERAATSSSFRTTLTPTLMFGAMTIAMCSACAAISAFWAGVEAGRADDGGDAELAAEREVGERSLAAA